MKTFVGIDLGTTNSAVCSYDGTETRIWKSPEQNDVTPSVIVIDRRGNKYVGKRAYDSAPHDPDHAAMLFKRLMGTSTPIKLAGQDTVWTPEECSAEVLKVLFGYLPEEVRTDSETGTVITVPAAFNQMQKEATRRAAQMAGLGKVALMQEPVAAVMSVMRTRNSDGIFLIFDLGGGTLDVAIAENVGGRVSLHAHGGIAMCGGRDFDRALMDHIVRPWLLETFNLPENFHTEPRFQSLLRLATWATERAKVELSGREEAVVSLSETEARIRDLDNKEIYLDIPFNRRAYDSLIADRIVDAVVAARETLASAGLTAHDLEKIVFIGGPTNYKPLRDKVAFELGIPGTTDVNPMTAVAEGASLFAESIDWNSVSRSRKTSRGKLVSSGELDLSFSYIARTPAGKARIAVQLGNGGAEGCEFQVDSADTGWTSGRRKLESGATVDVTLLKAGENRFRVSVFDPVGRPLRLPQDQILITKTAATVDAIPASHSVGIEVLEKLGGHRGLEYLVRAGEHLPKKGKKIFKAGEPLKAGSPSSLTFKLWEGEIEDPITDNRHIGALKISGADFDEGVIPTGADLECEFEILDSGNIVLEVSVPCIGGTFGSGQNFYSYQEGQLDYTAASASIAAEASRTLARLEQIEEVVDSPRLERARSRLENAAALNSEEVEIENVQEALENVHAARRELAHVRKANLKEIRQLELDGVVSFFNEYIRELARPTEASAFDNLVGTAQRAIDKSDKDFEYHIDELREKNFDILWRQDWYVVERFKRMLDAPHLFADGHRFEELSTIGLQLMHSSDIERLRVVVIQLAQMQIQIGGEAEQLLESANIVRG